MTDDSTTPPPPPEQPAGAQPAAPMSDDEAKTYLIISHIGMILTGFLAPLIVWLIGKDRNARIDAEAKATLNFGILYSAVWLIGAVLWVILIGGLIQLAAFVVALIFGIQGTMAVNQGKTYNYPFNITIVK